MSLFPIAESIGAVSSLFGMLSSASAERRAEAERQRYLSQLASQNDALYQNQLEWNNQTLQQHAGQGGDAIQALGRRLGDSLASAGVYGSSATAGALVNAQRDQNASLANLGAQLQQEAWRQRQQGLMDIGRTELGYANQDYDYARSQNADSWHSFVGAMGALGQSALASATAKAAAPAPSAATRATAGSLQGEAQQAQQSIASVPTDTQTSLLNPYFGWSSAQFRAQGAPYRIQSPGLGSFGKGGFGW